MSGSAKDSWKKLAKRLDRLTECPVCMGFLRPPVTVCERGHAVCPSCRGLLHECPLCRGSYNSQNNSLALNQILEALPRRCRYEVSGCREMFCVGEAHEEFCGFRPTQCRARGCGWRGAVTALQNHFSEAHSPPPLFLRDDLEYHLCFPDFQPRSEVKAFTPFIFGKEILWQMTVLDSSRHRLLMTWYRLPVGPPRGQVYAVMALEGGGLQYRHSVLTSSRDLGDSNLTGLEDLMTVPQAALPKLIRPNVGLVSSLRIVKE